MNNFVGVLGSLVLVASLSGCALQSGAEGGDAAKEQVGETTELGILGPPWIYNTASWSQGHAAVKLAPFASTICVLTRVTGKFSGTGEYISVYHDAANWYLGGGSQQSGVGGEATCFMRSNMHTNGNTFAVSADTGAFGRGISGCNGSATLLGNGTSVAVLNGIQGQMAGSGEYLQVDQATTSVGTNSVSAHSCSTYDYGFADSFTFDSTKVPSFMRPDGSTGDVDVVAAQTVNDTIGFVVLGPTAQSFCYFSYIQGGFYGNGEYVQIRSETLSNGQNYWVLRAGRGAASSYVGAGARCVARDQR